MDIEVEPGGNQAVVTIPALNFHDFDRTGKVNVASIQKLMTIARFLAYHTPHPETGSCFLEYDKLTADKYTFMASTRTDFDEALFRVRRTPPLPSYRVRLRLGYVGNASLNSVAELYCGETGHVYVTNTNQVVMVDKGTRKPTALPEWWRSKHAQLVPDGKPLVVPLIPVPEGGGGGGGTHTYDVKVPWTDMDNYKHANYVSYVRYCQDAALDGCHAGAFRDVTGDFLRYAVRSMAICYKGESRANDRLTVHVWQDDVTPLQLHFSIELKGAVIFQNTMTLFPPPEEDA